MPPLVLVVVAWIAGLLAAHHLLVPVGVEPGSLILLGIIPLAGTILWYRDREMALSGVCALAFLGGAVRYQAQMPDLQDPRFVARFNDRGWVTVEGVVRGYPDMRATWTDLELHAELVEVAGQSHRTHGRVLVKAPRYPEYRYGDRLRVSGFLLTPPELDGFSYREYLANRDIYALVEGPQIEKVASNEGHLLWGGLFALKDRARDSIARLMPNSEASLLQGILLGIRSGIPKELYDDYNATGASHVIVISGANIVVVAALFTHSFGRLLGRRQAYWFTLAGIALYVLLVGADPVVTRAGVMGSLYVTALYLGRRATAYVSLAAATMLLTLINPLTLWNVGFQLSAAATLGLILFTPPIEEALERCLTRIASEETSRTIVRLLSTVLVVTLAAQILTMPLVIHYFGRLSLVSPLSNFLILPVQPHIMGWGAVATVAGLVPQLELAARGVAMVPWLCLAFTNAIVRWMATWPFASIEIGNVHPGWLAAYYGLLFGGLWVARQGAEDARRLRDGAMRVLPSKAVVGVPLVALVIALLVVLQLPDGRLHVAFLDIGQGDAILITLPRGQQILVDGGPDPVALASALGREMPFWDRSINLVVLTHADADHVSGLPEVLKRFEVDNWLDNGLDSDNAAYLRCQELLEEAGTSRHSVRRGDRLDLVEGIVVEVLHPSSEMIGGDGESDTNNNSVVLRLDWAQVSFLLTGDLEAKGEGYLLRSDRHLLADVLKVSHHGSAASSTDDFLAAVAPSYAVISVSEENNFGHPNPSVLDRLDQRRDLEVLRTDEQGTVEFTTDGHRLWIRTDR